MKVFLFCKEYKRYSTKLRIAEKSLFNPFTLVSKPIWRFVVASTIESVVIAVPNCLETFPKEETNHCLADVCGGIDENI